MSRIHNSYLIIRSLDRGEPQPTTLDKLINEYIENKIRTIEYQTKKIYNNINLQGEQKWMK